MTLLQTRVTDSLAEAFETVAAMRGKSKYEMLADLVEQSTKDFTPAGWETIASRHKDKEPLPFNACEISREGER